MLTIRSLLLTEAVFVGTMIVGAIEPALERKAELATKVREAMSVSGTGLGVMSDAQAARLGTRLDELMQQESRGQAGLDEFLESVRLLKQTGAAGALPAFAGSRTLADVCRELGRLLLEEQRLEQEGHNREVVAFLEEVRAARQAGMSEDGVRRLVREGTKQRRLAPGAEDECRELQARADELLENLVDGEQGLARMARVHGVTKEALLSTLVTGSDVMLGPVRFGWL